MNKVSSVSVAWSLTPITTSVFITLWMSGTCLSPMPWMLCSPKPFMSSVGHSTASTAAIFAPSAALRWSPAAIVPADPVAETKAARRRPGRPAASGMEDALERRAGAQAVDQVVAVLAELVEDDVGRIAVEHRAGVVDLLDVALGARRADDVGGSATQRSSQSKRSWLMFSGSTATPRQSRMREMATPPRQ